MTINLKAQSLVLALALFSTGALWAGGSFVGNGAGLVENNFQYAYSSLNSLYSNCRDSENCVLTESELSLVQKMQEVIELNSSNAARILFISEVQNPNFFSTGEGEEHRIAKTGLTPNFPIYVNSDLLYSKSGTPALDFPTIISILTHEIGHQAGETNHAVLDILGSKMRRVIGQHLIIHQADLENAGHVEMLILNNDFPLKTADIFFSWGKVGTQKITSQVMSFLKCSNIETTLSGFEIVNGHYLNTDEKNETEPSVEFGMWINLYCYNPLGLTTKVEKNAMEFRVMQDMSIQLKSLIRMNPY
jgi:hypothetical protein